MGYPVCEPGERHETCFEITIDLAVENLTLVCSKLHEDGNCYSLDTMSCIGSHVKSRRNAVGFDHVWGAIGRHLPWDMAGSSGTGGLHSGA